MLVYQRVEPPIRCMFLGEIMNPSGFDGLVMQGTHILPDLGNVNKKRWKDPPFLIEKSTDK